MQKIYQDHEFTTYEKKLIRAKARKLSRAFGFTAQDIPDIEQELALELIRRLPLFDPSKAKRSTFAARVLGWRAGTMRRNLLRERRNPLRNGPSLNSEVINREGGISEMIEEVRQDHLDVMFGNVTHCQSESAALRIDVHEVLDRIDPRLRSCAEALMTESNVQAAAKAMGVHRTTIYASFMVPLREAFEHLGGYVGRDPTLSELAE